MQARGALFVVVSVLKFESVRLRVRARFGLVVTQSVLFFLYTSPVCFIQSFGLSSFILIYHLSAHLCIVHRSIPLPVLLFAPASIHQLTFHFFVVCSCIFSVPHEFLYFCFRSFISICSWITFSSRLVHLSIFKCGVLRMFEYSLIYSCFRQLFCRLLSTACVF